MKLRSLHVSLFGIVGVWLWVGCQGGGGNQGSSTATGGTGLIGTGGSGTIAWGGYTGGTTATGGTTTMGGSNGAMGGAPATGGAIAAGGNADSTTIADGGASDGGVAASGGFTGSRGGSASDVSASGGATPSAGGAGGMSTDGGASGGPGGTGLDGGGGSADGGGADAPISAGGVSGTGGASATGGATSTGGGTGAGGASATGGATSTGGSTGTGGGTVPASCGDGVLDWPASSSINPTEFCDDGNTISGDGCEPDCTLSPNPYTTHQILKYTGSISFDDDELGSTLATDRDWLVAGARPGGSTVYTTSLTNEYPRLLVYQFDPAFANGPRYVRRAEIGYEGVSATQRPGGVLAKISDQQIAWNDFSYKYADGSVRKGVMLFKWNGTTFAPRYHVAAPTNVDLCPQGSSVYCNPGLPTDLSLNHTTLAFSAALADIVVASPASDAGIYPAAGRAFIYDVSGDTPVLQASLYDVSVTGFGANVRVLDDVAVIGSATKIHVYRRTDSIWKLEQTLPCDGRRPLELDRNLLAVADGCGVSHSNAGLVSLYRHRDDGWTYDQTIFPIDYTPGVDFGRSLALSGDHLVVGAKGYGYFSGAAYAFKRDPSRYPAWQGVRLLTGLKRVNSGGRTTYLGTEAGWAVAAAGNAMIVGEPTERGTIPSSLPQIGQVHIFMDCDGGTDCPLKYCEPSTAVCSGGAAATCSADGYGSTVTSDCSASGQACAQGTCTAEICQPDRGRCQTGVAQRCADEGLSWSTIDTCASDEYCASGDGSWPLGCHTKVCTAGAQACANESAGICNADGSGLTSTTTNCRAQNGACVNGACATPIFYDGFESSSLGNWTPTTTTGGIALSSDSVGAMGTSGSMVLGNNTVVHNFATGVKPSYFGLWTSRASFQLRLYSSEDKYSYPLGFAYENEVAQQEVGLFAAGSIPTPVHWPSSRAAGWHLVEFRNIDWITRTFDFYYDGSVLKTGAALATGNSIGAIEIIPWGSGGHIDEVMMY